MKRTASLLAFALLAGCSSGKLVSEGDERFQKHDFDGAVASYTEVHEKHPGDAEVARKLEAAKKNAATAHAERAAKAAEEGDLDRADAEIRVSRGYDAGNARYEAEERKYAALRAEVAGQLARAKRSSDASEAHAILGSIGKYRATWPEIEILHAQVKGSYVKQLLAAAEDFGKAGQWSKSRASLEHAQEIAVKDAALAGLVKKSQTNVRVMELVDQGYKLKAQEDMEGALARFRTAVELRPDASEAVAALAATKRSLSETYVSRATEERDADRPLAAWVWLAKAEELDPETPEIESEKVSIQAAASAVLRDRAKNAAKKNLVGLEWLRLAQARIVDPENPGLERDYREASSKLDKAMRPVILVKSFRNATRQEGREVRLAAETYRQVQQQAQNGKLATVLDEDSYAIHLRDNPEFTPDIIVKATLERFDLIHHPERNSSHFKEYDHQVTFLDLQGKNYVQGIEKRTHAYVVTDLRVSGVGLMSYEIYDVGTRRAMAADTVSSELSREDRVVDGNAEAGIADDPRELPADAVLEDELQTQLKDRLLERMRSELGWVGKKYYTAYERARDSGDMDAAVSWAVIAMRSLSASGQPAIAGDLDFIARTTGYSLRDGKIALDSLR